MTYGHSYDALNFVWFFWTTLYICALQHRLTASDVVLETKVK